MLEELKMLKTKAKNVAELKITISCLIKSLNLSKTFANDWPKCKSTRETDILNTIV